MYMPHLTNINIKPGRNLSILLLIATAVLWSFGGILIKLVDWNPIAIAGMRSAIASLFILAIIKKPKIDWSPTQIGCAAAYAATVISFVAANKLTTAANAILLQYTAPIYVAIFSVWFLKERTKLIDWITIFFVIGGMLLFFIDNLTSGGYLGNMLAIFSGISFACLIMLMRKQKDTSPLESIFLGNVLTAIISLPFMFQSAPSLTSWIGLLILGVFQLGLSYVLYSAAIKHITALEASLIPVIEPVLNPVWVFLMIGEIPGTWAMIGGLVVISAITLRCVLLTIKSDTSDKHPLVNGLHHTANR
jgi:drug/metabolite transporter (DMT)-like permease